MNGPQAPLERVTSIKVKLGLLVAISVLVATVLATLGAGGSVPVWLAIPVTVLLALGVTQLLATGMTSPLRAMTTASSQMAAGDYSVRVPAEATDEVGQLARAFNRMAEDLATVDTQRRALVATVSHELRTPLAALCAVLENIEDGVTPADSATIGAALRQAERLSSLVNDLLDLSRLDAGTVTLDVTEVGASTLVGQAVAEVAGLGREVRHDLTGVPEELLLQADPARLTQVLVNLLDNATRHSPPGGTVRVSAGRSDGQAWLEVADEGSGVDPALRDRLFERFGATAHDPVGERGGGTGLGLAIARWVVELHGGRLQLVEPLPGQSGARFRMTWPQPPPVTTRPAPPTPARVASDAPGRTSTMPAPTAPPAPKPAHQPSQPVPAPPPLIEGLFGKAWPEHGLAARKGALLASVLVGLFAGLTLPFEGMGIAAALMLMAGGGVVFWLTPHRRDPFTLTCGVLALALAGVLVFRDAIWLAVLAMLLGTLLTSVGLVRPRTFLGILLSAAAWPFSGLRGLPWLGRTFRALGAGASTGAVLRTALWSVLALVIFGALFSSADAVFGHWVSMAIPDLHVGGVVLRGFVTVAVAGTVLASAYLAMNPPAQVDFDTAARRPVQRRYEWLLPVLLVNAVFALFLAAQAAAVFGGHDYIQRATGLTYAEYVHQGFVQLTLATALTLLVVWAAARKAATTTAADRLWLRVPLGALCLMTLVVVASALHRMSLYQDAYGFTRLRLLVDLFEGWLGLLVVAVLVAGVRLRAVWLPRAALLSGTAILLGLAVLNPDAWIAKQNLDRYEATGKVDWSYLQTLSFDATPTLARLDDKELACALRWDRPEQGSWAAWNLGRSRASHVLEGRQLPKNHDPESCPGLQVASEAPR